MQGVEPEKIRAAINVTPLVDVVLVLLIICMVIAPQLPAGPPVDLPSTDRPPAKADDGRKILVAIERDGSIWVDEDRIPAGDFAQRMTDEAERRAGWQVVIKGDAHLTFGQVRRTMLTVRAAGFRDVGLIAQRQES